MKSQNPIGIPTQPRLAICRIIEFSKVEGKNHSEGTADSADFVMLSPVQFSPGLFSTVAPCPLMLVN